MWHARAVTRTLGVAIIAAFALSAERSYAQGYGANDAPNPYKFEYGWAKLPDGRKWGAAVSVAIDRDGKSVWFVDRCAEESNGCRAERSYPGFSSITAMRVSEDDRRQECRRPKSSSLAESE